VKKIYLLFTFLFILASAFSQSYEVIDGDTVNRVDSDNLKQGKWIQTNKNSNQKTGEGIYIDGKKEGVWKSYYPGGALLSEITYTNDRKEGPAKIYYENGTVAEEGYWKHNKWIGEYKSYHENGKIAVHWNYNEEGNRSGEQMYYHKNGNVKIKGNWVNGEQNGEVVEYYENGNVKSKKTYENGAILENGIVFYDKNDENPDLPVDNEQQENNSEEKDPEVFHGEGYRTFYTKDKKVEKEGYFRNGYLFDGKHYIYNSEGTLIKTIIYKEGKSTEVIKH
jgi:antitoxin component YwqK of YwqJK toxin-antitoxin module